MFYPIMIDINDKDIVVVGGGEVAYSKSVKLLEFGANIKVLSPTKTDKFLELKEIYKEKLNFICNVYEKKYVEKAFLVVAATSSREVNEQISKDCKALKILANIVDSKKESDFITPSIINNDNLLISISTMGSFPYLSKKIRIDMEERYKKFNKDYIDILEKIRISILNQYKDRTKEIMDYALELDIEGLKDLLIRLECGTLNKGVLIK